LAAVTKKTSARSLDRPSSRGRTRDKLCLSPW